MIVLWAIWPYATAAAVLCRHWIRGRRREDRPVACGGAYGDAPGLRWHHTCVPSPLKAAFVLFPVLFRCVFSASLLCTYHSTMGIRCMVWGSGRVHQGALGTEDPESMRVAMCLERPFRNRVGEGVRQGTSMKMHVTYLEVLAGVVKRISSSRFFFPATERARLLKREAGVIERAQP